MTRHDPKQWTAILVGEVLEAVSDDHSGRSEDVVRAALVQEYASRGFEGITDDHDMVTEPAAVIAAGRPPQVDPRWL